MIKRDGLSSFLAFYLCTDTVSIQKPRLSPKVLNVTALLSNWQHEAYMSVLSLVVKLIS